MTSTILRSVLGPGSALAIIITTGCFAGPVCTAQSSATAHRQPVLVELFTSEGCSDCPPADALLARLDKEQFVPNAEVMVLSEHVTYWNHQGWEDRFSLVAADTRQDAYVRQFGLSSPATPEFVVDGTAQVAGTIPAQLIQEITSAATVHKSELQIEGAHRAADGSINFAARTAPGPKANLVAVVAENATQSVVAHGENAGRTLHNVAVVRIVKDFGSNAADGEPLRLSDRDLLRAEKDGEPLRLVVFLVSRSNGHVLAVAEQTLGQ
jgi:hypothetical protein